MSIIHPSPLYKYREDSIRTEEIFTNGKVWLSTADQLNDPLECKTGLVPTEWSQRLIRGMEDAQIGGFLLSAASSLQNRQPFYTLSFRAARRWFRYLKRERTRRQKYLAIKSFLRDQGITISQPAELLEKFDRQLSTVGVFSLSECPRSPPMWAHYASNGTGIAIGFARTPNCKLASQKNTISVTYSKSKPTFKGEFVNSIAMFSASSEELFSEQKIDFSDPTFRAAFSTKPLEWSYEREWRYVEEGSGLFPWPGPIASVVFGLKMPDTRRRHYGRLIRQHVPNFVDFAEVSISADKSSLVTVPWLMDP